VTGSAGFLLGDSGRQAGEPSLATVQIGVLVIESEVVVWHGGGQRRALQMQQAQKWGPYEEPPHR